MVVYASEGVGGAAAEPLLFDVTGKGDLCFSGMYAPLGPPVRPLKLTSVYISVVCRLCPVYRAVYALWREPELMPRLVVHAPVSEFVLRGADVMLPGVVFTSADEVASLRKGELRAVFARGNPGAIAVGEVLVDAEDISRTGKKGRALKLWHVFGDELWKLGPQTVPNDGFFANRVVPVDAQTGAAVEDDQDSDDAEEEDGDDEGEEKSDVPVSVSDIQLDDAGGDGEEQEQKTEEVSKEQMDAWYVSALLQALKAGKIKEKELPMLASTFHAAVLLPSRPASATLNLKQSSFKKLSVFLLHMQHRGLLAFSENNSGVQSITAISRRHPYVHARQSVCAIVHARC